jgi:4-amino-4-deoxy-L-arabinose transferase-like glycosyltransferase
MRMAGAGGAGVAAITLVGALLRFPTLGEQSYWLDEAVTVYILRLPFGNMLEAIPLSESTPPLYYVVAWLWVQVFGEGEFGLRALSALAGTATIPVAYLAARRFAGVRVGLVVAALAAANPLLVWFSQEARAYALLVLLATAALAVYARLLERPTGRGLAAWAVLSALTLATHYFAVFVVAPQLVWLLWRGRRTPSWRPVVAAGGAVVLAGVALLPILVDQASNDRADFIRSIGLAERIAQIPKQYLVGFDAPLETVSAIVALVLAAFGLWLLWRRTDSVERRGARSAAAVAVPAIAIPVLIAFVSVDYVVARNLIAAWVPAITVIAVGFGARGAGRAGVAAAGALCVLSAAVVIGVATRPEYQRGDWRGVAEALGPAPEGGRALVVSPGYGAIPLGLYARPVQPLPNPVAVPEIAVVAVAERRLGQTPTPPRPAEPPPAPDGFDLAEVERASTFTLVRYHSVSPVPVHPEVLDELKLAPGFPDFVFQGQPR